LANADLIQKERDAKEYNSLESPKRWANLPHLAGGNLDDCERDSGGSLILNPNGWGSFSLKIKTNKTRSGDTFRQAFYILDKNKKMILALPLAGQYFQSMRMDDDHGWYSWGEEFQFDPLHLNEMYYLDSGDATC